MESSKKEVVIKREDDHWAFLEHIEAPMWVDLTLEVKSCVENISDAWFNTSHLFHQWSSVQLKSKFSGPGDEVMTSEVDLQGPSSPELPSSVSRSRGNQYKSKKWRGDNLDVLLDKQNAARGLNRKFFQADCSGGLEVKAKSNVVGSKRVSTAKPGLCFKSKASGRNVSSNRTKPVGTHRNPTISSSSAGNSTSKSDTRSTITSLNSYRQPKYTEVSSQPCHLKSGPLSFRGVNLRKSCVTMKKGSRLETDGGSRQSRGRKSSSGKSSVGSSSSLGYEVKFVSKQHREKIMGGTEVAWMDITAKKRCKPLNGFRESSVLVEGTKFSKRREINLGKPVYHRGANLMVQNQTTRLRALSPGRVSKQNSSVVGKEKPGTGKISSLAGKGKENAAKNEAMREKFSESAVSSGGMVATQIIMEQKFRQKGGRAGLASSKIQVKAIRQREAKNLTNLPGRVYLR